MAEEETTTPSQPQPQLQAQAQAQTQKQPTPQPSPQPQPLSQPSTQPQSDPSITVPEFDPSRMIGIIRRKALIKDLAAAYHAECLDYCQELLGLQRRWEEIYKEIKALEDSRKDTLRPPKRAKKVR